MSKVLKGTLDVLAAKQTIPKDLFLFFFVVYYSIYLHSELNLLRGSDASAASLRNLFD